MLIFASHLYIGIPSNLFLQGFVPKPCIGSFHTMHATCTTHLILDLIMLTFDVEYKLWSSYSFLQPNIISFSVSCSQIPPVYVLPLMSETMFATIENYGHNYTCVYFSLYVFRQKAKRWGSDLNDSMHYFNSDCFHESNYNLCCRYQSL
jgi:hypothetical protein